MSTLVPSRTLFVPWTPSSNTLLHKHADKVHPQKQIFKGQAKQEPFHAHKIQNVFSTKKNARTYFLCTQLLSPGAQVCGCYVRAHTDANSRTTIAKAGKRRRRGGGSREEDAARPEGGSRHHSPDAEMPGQERPVTASPPMTSPAVPSQLQPALMSPRRCCSGRRFAAQAPANLAERSASLPCAGPAAPPAGSTALAAAAAAGLGRTEISGNRDRVAPFPQRSAYQASLNPFISTVTISRCPRPCLPTDSSRGPRTYWRRPGRRASPGERRAPCTEPPAAGCGRRAPPAPPQTPAERHRAPHTSSARG